MSKKTTASIIGIARKSSGQIQRETAERNARLNQSALALQTILDNITRKRLGHA